MSQLKPGGPKAGVFYERVTFEVPLVCDSDVHFGAGETRTSVALAETEAKRLDAQLKELCRDARGHPYIPASTLRGFIRAVWKGKPRTNGDWPICWVRPIVNLAIFWGTIPRGLAGPTKSQRGKRARCESTMAALSAGPKRRGFYGLAWPSNPSPGSRTKAASLPPPSFLGAPNLPPRWNSIGSLGTMWNSWSSPSRNSKAAWRGGSGEQEPRLWPGVRPRGSPSTGTKRGLRPHRPSADP